MLISLSLCHVTSLMDVPYFLFSGCENDDNGGYDFWYLLASVPRLLHCVQRLPINHILKIHSGKP